APVANVNDAPVPGTPLADAVARQGQPFAFSLPPAAFVDVDAGDTLTLAATLDDGSALPTWLRFDAATGTLSGTPDNADVGPLGLRFTATDAAGLSADARFTLTVIDVNDAPQLAQPLADVAATQDQPLGVTLPDGSFTDIDAGDSRRLSATLADGTALPAWLRFDAASGRFTGTPGNDDVGRLAVRVTATDAGGLGASGVFQLTVANVNDAPVLARPVGDARAVLSVPFTLALPADTFVDIDVGDTLILSATQADGSALPAWLQFDAATRRFTGAPTLADAGVLTLRVTATDSGGLTRTDDFVLAVVMPAAPTRPGPEPEGAAPAAPAAPSEAPAAEPDAPSKDKAPADRRATAPVVAALAAVEAEPTPSLEPLPDAQRAGMGFVVDAAAPASRADTVLAPAVLPQFAAIDLGGKLGWLGGDDAMARGFEEMKHQLELAAEQRHAEIASSMAVTATLSIGYVIWLVRGGVLLSTMLSALPAWQLVDPMPVLAAAGGASRLRRAARTGADDEGDDGKVERLFDGRARALPVEAAARAEQGAVLETDAATMETPP
ncbi:MAG: putative Ig domain-containing protein, partial [Rubrivivax sp.]|nr:putative Ig domain-containing protein [Rubrivivax sp.]